MNQHMYSLIYSHIYDFYALLSGTITFIVIYFFKYPIKKINYRLVYGTTPNNKEKNPDNLTKNTDSVKSDSKLRLRYQRMNLILYPLIFLVGAMIFSLNSRLSYMIEFSTGSALLSGFAAIAEYALYDQIFNRRK